MDILGSSRTRHQARRNLLRGALLLGLFLLVWVSLGGVLGDLLAARLGGALIGAVLFGVLALASVLYAFLFGKATILSIAGARPADPTEHAELFTLAAKLAARAAVPTPRLYVIDDVAPNACATGRDPAHAALAVTSGLLRSFPPDELEGVIAHELTHIRNRDVFLLLITSTAIALLALLAGWGAQALETGLARDSGDDDNGKRFAILLILAQVLLTLVALVIGPLIQLAISRSRESLADLGAAELSGSPTGLLRALQRLEKSEAQLRRSNPATAALYIDNPMEHHEHWFNGLLDSHPPIEARIQVLQQIAGIPATAVTEHLQREVRRRRSRQQRKRRPEADLEILQVVVLVGSILVCGGLAILWILFPHLHGWVLLAGVLIVISIVIGTWLSSRSRSG